MKIEFELKNTKPMPPRQRALVNVLFTASWLDCFLTRGLRPFGLTHPQYNILRILNGSYPKGLSVLDIKSRMIDRSSNVSRLVEKLRQNNLAERVPHSEDRRMVVITISEAGKKLLVDIEKALFSADGMPVSESSAREVLPEAEVPELVRRSPPKVSCRQPDHRILVRERAKQFADAWEHDPTLLRETAREMVEITLRDPLEM